MSDDTIAKLLLQLAGKDERIAELVRDVEIWHQASGKLRNQIAELEAKLASEQAHNRAQRARIEGLEQRGNGESRKDGQ